MADSNLMAPMSLDIGPDDLAALVAATGEDDALASRRAAAAARLTAATAPSRTEHLWRFTDPGILMPTTCRPSTVGAPPASAVDGAARVDLAPGREPRLELSEAARAAGLEIGPLSAARLGAAAPADAYFTGLNDALWSAGAAIRVPDGAVLDGAIHVVVHADGVQAAPRLLLDVGVGAEVVLVEEHRGGGEDTRVVGVTEILAAAGARVRHVVVQTWGADVHGYLGVHARADRDADVHTVFCSLGGRRAKLELVTTLAGEGAHSGMTGVTLVADRQHLDHHTRHVHAAGRTSSDIDFKAVAAGRSRSSYTGLIRIETDAREVEAFQENRNLLLSDASRADTIPELEILNQEVSCSHGATVAPIDERQVFYLQSRGIPRLEARRLVVRGFLEKTLGRLPDDLRARVETIVEARLDDLEAVS